MFKHLTNFFMIIILKSVELYCSASSTMCHKASLTVPHTFRLLTDETEHTPDNIKRANILGWCVELVSLKASCELMHYDYRSVWYNVINKF